VRARFRYFVVVVGISSSVAGTAETPPPDTNVQSAAGTQVRQSLGAKQNTVRTIACEAAVPPDFALAVLDQESGFDNSMRGSQGEIGVSQILPSTAVALGFDVHRLRREFSYNARAGIAILRKLLNQSRGDRSKALCSYRAGPGWVHLKPRYRSYVRAYVSDVELLMRKRYAGVNCQ
jgi:soluble lytic murein transglycosylase-like protein